MNPRSLPPAFLLAAGLAATLAAAPGCTVKFGSSDKARNCGNLLVDPGEECDDGDRDSGDGCAADCRAEEGWLCSGEPSVCEPICGDGLARGEEACDGSDLRNLTCDSLGLGEGQLACTEGCIFDLTDCAIQAECGNANVEYPEECDRENLAGRTCPDLGFDTGTLTCASDCTFDTSRCRNVAECGDGDVEGTEQCDGNNLAGQTCESMSLGEGTLACNPDCTFDTSGCSIQAFCGNNAAEFPELCDGADLDGYSCTDFGFYGGTLACLSDCSNFDTSECSGFCGDNSANGSELCDGADLGGYSCADFQYYGGTLACQANCSNFDTTGCWTEPVVKINELSHGYPDWVELVNLSAVAVDLQNWVLDTRGYYNQSPDPEQLTLPSYSLGPGARVVILDETTGSGAPPTVNQSAGTIQFHVNVSWGNNPGAATLIDDGGHAVDFVRWGGTDFNPPAGTNWSDAPRMLLEHNGGATTLSRVPDGHDTDTAQDFCIAEATAGAANGPCLGQASAVVLITEISPWVPDRLELYNPGSAPVNLLGWTVYWTDDAVGTTGGNPFPAYTLGPGAYVVVDDTASQQNPYVQGSTIHLTNIDWTPPDPGSCALLDPALNGVDFVRWGGSAGQPFPPDQWSDTPSPLSCPANNHSLGRDTLTDTNTAGDWCHMSASIGGPNGYCY